MNGYLVFYAGKQIEVQAATSYAAQQLAIARLRVPRSKHYLVTPVLAEKNGAQVTHSTATL